MLPDSLALSAASSACGIPGCSNGCSAPDLALRAQVGVPDSLMTQVMEGVLDIAVIYAPQHRPGLKIELLFEEKLVLVTTDPDASRTGLNPETAVRSDYVYVDWGTDFMLNHNVSFQRR